MGTRNLTCVHVDGDMKVAQYCQWDGYPSGQGTTILEFLSGKPAVDDEDYDTKGPRYGIDGVVFDRVLFAEKVRASSIIGEKEIEALWEENGIAVNGYSSHEAGAAFSRKYPHVCRDIGGHILSYIQKNEPLQLCSQVEFSADSLFCEWAYVVDLDTEVFEVYKGFQTEPNEDRFAEHFQITKSDKQWYPVKLVAKYLLCDLPSVEEFLADLEEEE